MKSRTHLDISVETHSRLLGDGLAILHIVVNSKRGVQYLAAQQIAWSHRASKRQWLQCVLPGQSPPISLRASRAKRAPSTRARQTETRPSVNSLR
jgi:hypothetical protein